MLQENRTVLEVWEEGKAIQNDGEFAVLSEQCSPGHW